MSLKQWRDQKIQLIAYYKSLIFKMPVFNKKGQGLIEYLIIIAIMAVASIGILRTLNQTVKAKFANSIYALQGKRQKASTESVRKTDYKKTDFSNFMTGAASNDKKILEKAEIEGKKDNA